MRVVDAVGGLVELTSRVRRPAGADEAMAPGGTGARGGPLEARLAGVLVAALKEAFDRDSARLDLERAQVEAERQRADQLLHAEFRRQATERALAHLRMIAIVSVAAWALSAALAVWLPGMRAAAPRVLLGLGWASAFASLGCAFAGWKSIHGLALDANAVPEPSTVRLAPWLLLAGLAAIAASLLFAL